MTDAIEPLRVERVEPLRVATVISLLPRLQRQLDADRSKLVETTIQSITGALDTSPDPVTAALIAMTELLDEASDWSPQEIADTAAVLHAEALRRTKRRAP